MAFWRQLIVLSCACWMALVSGCTPAPNSPLQEGKEPYVVQGQSREHALDYSGAIESYHRALEVNPHNSVAHYHLALLYERDDRDAAAAIYHFQRFLKLRPNSDNAAAINQRIIGCKQALARDVALGPVSGEMQKQLDDLLRTNQQLVEDGQRLALENRQLKDQLARVQAGTASGGLESASSTASASRAALMPTPPPASTARTYTVREGDTYYKIASRYGISPASLEAANPGVNPRQLRIGQQLVVPTH